MKKVVRIGHRGAAGHAPENTLSSFRKAMELKADMVELDVHICRTRELVVIHDEKVNRTTNGKGFVTDKTLKELKDLRINKTEKIPTLIEVLDLISGKCKINIELKGKGTAKPVDTLLKKYIQKKKLSYSDILVSSYDFSMLEEIKEINSKIRIGLLVEKIPRDIIKIAKKMKAYSINPNRKYVNQKFVKETHLGGLNVFVYTVNKKGHIKKMKELGVEGIISNYPERI